MCDYISFMPPIFPTGLDLTFQVKDSLPIQTNLSAFATSSGVSMAGYAQVVNFSPMPIPFFSGFCDLIYLGLDS
jgi:hypothetical protein